MKDLSIILPVYNGENYIERCIKSILQTAGVDYEIIIINDASTDHTETKIKKLENDSITIISLSENKGVSYCRNLGIEKAKGKYITFIDADDYIEKEMYSILLQKAQEEDLDVCYCNNYELFEKTGKIVKSKYQLKNKIVKQPEIMKLYLTDQISRACWDKIYKADLLKNNIKVEEELAVGEDILFVLDVMKESKKIGVVDSYFYYYVQQEKSVMHTISPKFLQFKKVIQKTLEKEYETMRLAYSTEYEYFQGEMLVRGIHSISTLANKENKKQAIQYMTELVDKKTLKQWIKNPYGSRLVKIEIQILLLFGIRMHLLLMPIYKYMRGKLRK